MHTLIYPDKARLDDGLVEFYLDLIGAFLKDFGIDMFLELLFGLREAL